MNRKLREMYLFMGWRVKCGLVGEWKGDESHLIPYMTYTGL